MSKGFLDAATSKKQLEQSKIDILKAGENIVDLGGSALNLGADVVGAGSKIGGSVLLGAAVPVLGNAAQAVCLLTGASGASAAIGTGLTAVIMNPLVLPAVGLVGGIVYAAPQIKDAGTQVYNIVSNSFGAVKNVATSTSKATIGGIVGIRELVSSSAQNGKGQISDNDQGIIIWEDENELDLNAAVGEFLTREDLYYTKECTKKFNEYNYREFVEHIEAVKDFFVLYVNDTEAEPNFDNVQLLMAGEVEGLVYWGNASYTIIDDYQA
jgi:hypothetical protein